MNCCTAEVKWVENWFLTVWVNMWIPWKEKGKSFSNYFLFPAVIPTFVVLSTLPVTGFVIWAVHVFFIFCLILSPSCHAEAAYFWCLTLSAGLSILDCHQICFVKSLPSPMCCLLCYHITAADGSLKVPYYSYV